jgi:hypothetical protein
MLGEIFLKVWNSTPRWARVIFVASYLTGALVLICFVAAMIKYIIT